MAFDACLLAIIGRPRGVNLSRWGQPFIYDFDSSRSIVRARFSFWTRYRALLIVQLQTKRLLQGIGIELFAVRRRIRPPVIERYERLELLLYNSDVKVLS